MSQARRWALGVAGVLLVPVVWEGYKAIGPADGVVVGGTTVLPRTSDLAMPHVWTMFARLGEPVLPGRGGDPLWQVVVGAAGVTLGVAAVGWVVGVVVGFLLALLMQRIRLAEASLLPWIVVSQTVPLIALAPLVAGLVAQAKVGGQQPPIWFAVALIASYLAFFPVSIGALRGLGSPQTAHVELLHSYAVGWWQTLFRLRLPASVPFLLSALRLAAANAIVGTVVAEVSIGMGGGLGRMMVEYASAASGDPGKPWAPIFGAIAIGLVSAGAVALLGLTLGRYRRVEVGA